MLYQMISAEEAGLHDPAPERHYASTGTRPGRRGPRLERSMKINEDLLRFLTVKLDEKELAAANAAVAAAAAAAAAAASAEQAASAPAEG
jgi:hypothetical protein